MAGWRAAKLCPEMRFVRGHFDEYQRLGDAVIAIFEDFTPLVERISIDEAFLDVSGSVHLFGSPAQIGAILRQRVRDQIGLPISVGAARTKHLATIASQVAKPDGIVIVQPGREREFLDPLPVGLIWGVGPVNEKRLADLGVRTIGDLAVTPSSAVEDILGYAVGHKLSAMAHDDDPCRVVRAPRARSVGAQSAIGQGRTVTVRVRFAGMRVVTRSHTLAEPNAATLTLTEVAERLVWSAIADHPDEPEITLLAISVSHPTDQMAIQPELDLAPSDPWRPGSATGAARRAVDGSMDEFRELAEHDL